jgi:LacI family transcriptional regulator
MLSNGTIDGFIVSVSESAENQDYDHFSALYDGTQ